MRACPAAGVPIRGTVLVRYYISPERLTRVGYSDFAVLYERADSKTDDVGY